MSWWCVWGCDDACSPCPAANLFKLLKDYKPEDKAAKKARLLKVADGSAPADKTKPVVLKHGINHVTKLIEDKKATLVIIAYDVDPIEVRTLHISLST